MINIKQTIVWYMLGVGAISAVQWSYYTLAPVSHFLKYSGKVSLVGEAKANQPIEFLSKTFIRSGTFVKWADVLRCRVGNAEKFSKYSSKPFDRMITDTERPTDNNGTWFYTGKVPAAGSLCYLEYAPVLKLKYGITRSVPQDRTEVFKIQ